MTYQYRVRFCWWGAEELGLLGSIYHIAQALNCDMIASPNYYFGIHDVLSVPATTPPQALNGTDRISGLFRQWFNEQNLPWGNSSLIGSDFIPFLAAGVAVGDVHTGTREINIQPF